MLLYQLRDAQRALRRSLPVSLTIVMCLGFGMGSVTVVYSWYQGLIQHPLPAVTQTDDLVTVRSRATTGATLTSLPEYRDWHEQAQSLSDLAASSLHLFGVSMTGDAGGLSEPVFGMFASPNYFRVLRLVMPIGRDFEAADDTVDAEGFAVIVSHRLWTGRFGARPDVLGRPIRLNGRLGAIVGVAPPLFGGTLAGASFDLWVPLSARASLVPPEAELIESRSLRWLDVVGRLQRDVTISQVREEFASVGRRSAEAHAESRGRTIEVVPLDTGTVQQLRPLFVSLLVLSAVVLLIVCSNVTNLLLVRGTSRVREISIRLALGRHARTSWGNSCWRTRSSP
jgi:putative ABC transport system permease protein